MHGGADHEGLLVEVHFPRHIQAEDVRVGEDRLKAAPNPLNVGHIRPVLDVNHQKVHVGAADHPAGWALDTVGHFLNVAGFF